MLLTTTLYCLSMYQTLIPISRVFLKLFLLCEVCSGYVQGTISTHLPNFCLLPLPTLMCTVITRGRAYLFSISHLGLHVAMNTSTVHYGPEQAALSLSGLSPCVSSYCILLSCYSQPVGALSLNFETAKYNTCLHQVSSSIPHLE